jgi:hypothetical protein
MSRIARVSPRNSIDSARPVICLYLGQEMSHSKPGINRTATFVCLITEAPFSILEMFTRPRRSVSDAQLEEKPISLTHKLAAARTPRPV